MTSFLVTGVGGYIGTSFSKFLIDENADNEIFGFGLDDFKLDGLEYEKVDLTDMEKTEKAILEIRPDFIFHFAGVANHDNWETLIRGNVRTTIVVLEAALKLGKAKTVVIGSAAEYGIIRPEELPVKETHALDPFSKYGISMACRSTVTRGFAKKACNVAIGRLFNPIGPGLREKFALGSFAKQVKEMAAGNLNEISVGNLQMKRDFIDIDDACKAFLAIGKMGKSGEEYNVCSGKSYELGALLELMLKGKNLEAKIKIDDALIGNTVVSDIYGSISKIKADTGWEPKISIEESIRRIIL